MILKKPRFILAATAKVKKISLHKEETLAEGEKNRTDKNLTAKKC